MLNRLLLAALALLLPTAALAEAHPATLFSDHMVLQSGMLVPIWGTADPNEKVTLTFLNQHLSTTASADGKWMLRLANLKPGGPYEMSINSLVIHDILVGEVWLASGQSNMAFTVSKAHASYAGMLDEEKVIAAANYPQLRMFTGKTNKTYEPQSTVEGQWLICSPATVGDFSAVGYLFGRNLNQALNTPVGILTEAFGGSTAEAWIPRETMAGDPLLKPMLDKFDTREAFFKANPTAMDDVAPAGPQTVNARPAKPAPIKDPVQDQHQPTVLYNGMIAPVVHYAIRGAIWYQGESIVGGAQGVQLYGHVMQTLVTDWRKRWGEGDFPFYVVQLAALKNVSNNPMVREQQATILSLPKTGMAVTIDIGDPTNVHPKNKEPLGFRLSSIALANVYGRKVEYAGPTLASSKIDGAAIRLKFTHAEGMMAKDGPLKWFQIAGPDHKFVDAEATISGDTITVRSPQVAAPVAVRYAWDDYPEGANLYNSAGFPAAPFRTDNFDALTPIAANFTGK